MEWVEVIERTSEYVRIRYYPNQSRAVGEFGEVKYFLTTGKWTFDKVVGGTNYAMHAVNFVRLPHENGEEIPSSGISAWH